MKPLFRSNHILEKLYEESVNDDDEINITENHFNCFVDVDIDADNFNVKDVNDDIIDLNPTVVEEVCDNSYESNVLFNKEDIKHYKQILDSNSIRAKHTFVLVLEMIKLNLKNKQYLLNDHLSSELLTEGSNVTKSEFVTEFVNTIHRNGGSIKLSNEIFHLLRNTFVNSKLNDIVDNCCKSNISNKLNKFISPNNNIIHIDICPINACMAFLEDTNQMIYCTFCRSQRFTNCSQPTCKTASYQECNHPLEDRIPIKCIFYIPLIPTLVDLIQTPNFMYYYNFTFNAPLLHADIYTEAIHGNMSQQNAIPSMTSKGNMFSSKWVTHLAPRDRNDNIKTINVLLPYFLYSRNHRFSLLF